MRKFFDSHGELSEEKPGKQSCQDGEEVHRYDRGSERGKLGRSSRYTSRVFGHLFRLLTRLLST